MNNLDYQNLVDQLFSSSFMIIYIAIYLLLVVAMWKLFTKAGYAGIWAVIPIVNLIFLIKIAGYSGWLVLLYLIPIVNIVFSLMVAFSLGRRFGHGGFFSFIFLWLIPIFGYFMIGFGRSKYTPVRR